MAEALTRAGVAWCVNETWGSLGVECSAGILIGCDSGYWRTWRCRHSGTVQMWVITYRTTCRHARDDSEIGVRFPPGSSGISVSTVTSSLSLRSNHLMLPMRRGWNDRSLKYLLLFTYCPVLFNDVFNYEDFVASMIGVWMDMELNNVYWRWKTEVLEKNLSQSRLSTWNDTRSDLEVIRDFEGRGRRLTIWALARLLSG